MKVEFIVITKASLEPNDDTGNFADNSGFVNEEEGFLYIDSGLAKDTQKGDKRIIFPIIEPVEIINHGKKFKITRIRTPVFFVGEIIIANESGREIVGLQRKPTKWWVDYEKFDKIEDAIERSREVLQKEGLL